jgi:hypothetical protein
MAGRVAQVGILIANAKTVRMTRFHVHGFKTYGVWMRGWIGSGATDGLSDSQLENGTIQEYYYNESPGWGDVAQRTAVGLFIDHASDTGYTDVSVSACLTALKFSGESGHTCANSKFVGCKFWGNPSASNRVGQRLVDIRLNTVNGAQFIGCRFDDMTTYVEEFQGTQFVGCRFIQCNPTPTNTTTNIPSIRLEIPTGGDQSLGGLIISGCYFQPAAPGNIYLYNAIPYANLNCHIAGNQIGTGTSQTLLWNPTYSPNGAYNIVGRN